LRLAFEAPEKRIIPSTQLLPAANMLTQVFIVHTLLRALAHVRA